MDELVRKFGWTYDNEGAFAEDGTFMYAPGYLLDPTGKAEMPYQKNEEKKLFKEFLDSLPNDGIVRDGWASNIEE